PLWLSPVQARVLTLTERQEGYGAEVAAELRAKGLRVEVDARNEKLGYKVRQAQLEKLPYMLVVGDREAADRKVAPRLRSGEQLPVMSAEEIASRLADEVKPPAIP